MTEVSGLSILSDSDCQALTDEVINYDPDFDLCAGRKEIVQLHTEPIFKVQDWFIGDPNIGLVRYSKGKIQSV